MEITESDLTRLILAALWREYPDGLWYRRNTGAAMINGHLVRYGVPGMADIGGIWRARAYEIEIKTAKGRQTEEQKNWQRAVERAGGTYLLWRSVDDVKSLSISA